MSIRDTIRSIATFGAAPQASPGALAVADPPREMYALSAGMIGGVQVGRPTWPSWDPSLATGYARLALIFRCMNIVAHTIGTAPVRVYDEARDDETIPDHPMRRLMKRPNPRMGEASFWSNVAIRAQAAGFCLCEKERNRLGDVIALWPMNASWLKAIGRRDGSHDWEYRVPGVATVFRLPAEDVVPFRYADTVTGSPYGMGPLEACLREVGLSNAMTDFLKLFFETGAVPLHGIIPEPDAKRMSQQEVDDMLDAFMVRRGGLGNASRPIYLQAIRDIKRLGFDFDELAYTDLRDLTELGIVQAFGIPASVAQIRVGLEHSDSRANAEVDEGKLYRQTIIPLWTRWDDALTLNLLPDFEPATSSVSMEFDTSGIEALQEDRNAKAVWVNQAATGGIISVHSWHREMGLPLPDGEDYFLRSLAIMAIPASDPIGELPEPAPPAPIAPPAEEPPDDAQLAAIRRQTMRGLGYSGRLARVNTDRQRIARVAKRSAPSLQAFLNAQQKRIVPQAVKGLAAHGPSETLALQSIDWEKENQRLQQVTRRLHMMAGTQAFTGIAESYGLDVGISFDLKNPDVARVIDKLADQVTQINDTTRQDIAERVTAGLNDGKSVDEIAESLNGLFEETYRGRALAIARTESMFSYGEASLLGYQETGVVDRAQIFDNPDHDEDYGASDGLTCATRDGIIVPLESAMDHIYADHPNGSACMAPVLIGEAAG